MASGGVILETKKQPETLLLKYSYSPPENNSSRRHGFIPTFTYLSTVRLDCESCVHVNAGQYVQINVPQSHVILYCPALTLALISMLPRSVDVGVDVSVDVDIDVNTDGDMDVESFFYC